MSDAAAAGRVRPPLRTLQRSKDRKPCPSNPSKSKPADAASMVQLLLAAGAYVIGADGSPNASAGPHHSPDRQCVNSAPGNGGTPAESAMFVHGGLPRRLRPRAEARRAWTSWSPTNFIRRFPADEFVSRAGAAFDQTSTVQPGAPPLRCKLALAGVGLARPQHLQRWPRLRRPLLLGLVSKGCMVPADRLRANPPRPHWIGPAARFERRQPNTWARWCTVLG